MAGEWKRTSLREAGVTLIDCDHRTPPAADSGYPYVAIPQLKQGRLALAEARRISPEHFADWTRKAKPQHHDVILSRRCNPGETAFVPAGLECALGQNLVLLRSDGTKVFPPFLRWLLNGPDWWEQVGTFINVGAIFNSLKCADIPNFKMPLPPVAEQKAIAAVLGALDDKIELNRRMNATLEAMARSLFQSWFVDFDPVRANLDGRQPAGLDTATAALFPSTFQDSPLGHIPEGWKVKTIEELSERVAMGPFGSDIKVSTFVPEGIPVVSGQHLRGTLLEDSEFNFVSVEHADRLKRSNVQPGDVIFTHAGSIGQVAYIPETSRYKRYIVSQRQFYMRCNRSLVSPFYITSYFKTPEGQHRLLANTSSTGVPSISQPVTYLRQLKMVVPPASLLAVFNATVSAIHLKMADNDHQSRTLATLRDSLLPKLLSGELSASKPQD
jgi:type I restriction enzyme S subunit